MRQKEISKLSLEELTEKIKDHTDLLAKKKMSHRITEIENPISIRDARKTVARLKTELRKRELQA
ncbi:MAG: 50S ribosomal protein L29 [Flavobacteriales bacterium]